MRVSSENLTPRAWLRSKSICPPKLCATRVIDFPSDVSSNTLAAKAILAISSNEWPLRGINSCAKRLPKVIVPVLSRIRVVISAQASRASPEVAMMLNWATPFIAAILMVLNNPPIVVGISPTNRAIKIGTLTGLPT